MEIKEFRIKVSDISNGYINKCDEGVFGYGGKLTIRPNFQREFIYKDKQRDAVIDTVFKNFPLNTMYWSKNKDGSFEMIDGQQRTISICDYVSGGFPVDIDKDGNKWYFSNLKEEDKNKILNYDLSIYICEGTEKEKLDWFRVINIAGEVLTPQELLNATYAGPWTSDAKMYFSKRDCAAGKVAQGYIRGNPIRQDYLEKVLNWISDRDGVDSIPVYMAKHQFDEDANELWSYFQEAINWGKSLFPTPRKGITDSQDWGILYNRYKDNTYDPEKLEKELVTLTQDDDVTKQSGIIPYLLSDRTVNDEKYLSIRAFTENQKRRAYEKQKHICPICGKEFKYDEMHGDHIIPWSQGGHTTDDNLQMLCKECNRTKGDH